MTEKWCPKFNDRNSFTLCDVTPDVITFHKFSKLVTEVFTGGVKNLQRK
jgi:hypothetical protein